MKRAKVTKELREAINAYFDYDAQEKAIASKKRSAKTALKNALKEQIMLGNMTPDDAIYYDHKKISLRCAEKETVDVARLYNMLKKGKITEEQFLRSISGNKRGITNAIGGDVLLTLTVTDKGKIPDVRVEKVDEDTAARLSEYDIVTDRASTVKLVGKGKALSKNAAIKPRKVRVSGGR